MKIAQWVLLLTLVIAITLCYRKEMFTTEEVPPHVREVRLDDEKPDLSGFTQKDAKVDSDMMQQFVVNTTQEIKRRTGMCVDIIETAAVRQYEGEDRDVYECMFMALKRGGYVFGFTVVSTMSMKKPGGEVSVMALRTQPIDADDPSDITPFVQDVAKEFVDYELVREKVMPTLSELEVAKNKFE